MKANIPQRTDTPLQVHGASQVVNIRCPTFYVCSNRTKTPALPIEYSGLGALVTLNFAIDWRQRIDLIAFWQNISLQYSFECYFFCS
jgi:hypothetical protein